MCGRMLVSGGSGGGGLLVFWSLWMRMWGIRGFCRVGGGVLGLWYRYSVVLGFRLEIRFCG